MSYKVLKSNGEIEHRNSIRQLTTHEWESAAMTKQRVDFDVAAEKALGASMEPSDLRRIENQTISAVTPEYEPYEDEDQPAWQAPDADDYDADAYNAYITSQVLLPKGDQMWLGTVRRQTKDANGNPVGRANNNPILDSRLYVDEFPDGESLEYAANIIAENIYSQVDDKGRQQMLLDKIVDHQTDENAAAINDGYAIHNGRSSQKYDGSYVYNGRTGQQVGRDLLT
jgi:hypothetical protein